MRLDHVGQDQGIKADKHPKTWGEVGDEVDSKDKSMYQSKIELIRYYMICKHNILRSSSEI
jgi:hypothetical protein